MENSCSSPAVSPAQASIPLYPYSTSSSAGQNIMFLGHTVLQACWPWNALVDRTDNIGFVIPVRSIALHTSFSLLSFIVGRFERVRKAGSMFLGGYKVQGGGIRREEVMCSRRLLYQMPSNLRHSCLPSRLVIVFDNIEGSVSLVNYSVCRRKTEIVRVRFACQLH